MSKINRQGGCIVFAWGPPWHWLPSVQRSKYHCGLSLTWLWWGFYWAPVSAGTLMLEGIYPRCEECQQHTVKLDERWLCADCAAKSQTGE